MFRSIFAITLLLTSAALNAATMVVAIDGRLHSYDADTGIGVDIQLNANIQANSITAGGGQIYGYNTNNGLIEKYSAETLDYAGSIPGPNTLWLIGRDTSNLIYGDGFVWSYAGNSGGGLGFNVDTGVGRGITTGPVDTNLLAFGNHTLFTFDAESGAVFTNDAATGMPTDDDGFFLTSGMSGDSLVYGDGILFGSNGAGFINKYDALTGAYLGQIDVTGTVSDSLIYGEGVLYSADTTGILQRYDASTGAYLGDFANYPGLVGVDPQSWAFVPTVVPVPAAIWLFGSALAGLGFIKRKRPGTVA